MSRRAVLWVAFVVVHAVVAILGFVWPSQPMGDVYFVYEPWSLSALNGGAIVGVTEAWVYPQWALVPMVLAHGFAWIAGYEVGWALLVTGANALAFAMVVGRARSVGRVSAAWFWLAFILLLGPVGMYRLDAITVPLAVAGCLWLVGRPFVASLLLSVATWMKVWPAALLAAAVVAVRRRALIVAGALVVSGCTLVVVALAGGAAHAFGFISGQTERGLQLEAPVSMYYLWRAVAGIEGSFIFYDPDILTFQVTGPQVDPVIALMTPLLAIVVLAICGVGAFAAWRGAHFVTLFPPLAISLVLALWAVNKVGSPQFLTWLIAPIVLALVVDHRRWRGFAVTALVAAGLTQIIYPLLYDQLLLAQPVAAAVLTARNLLMIGMLGWALARLVRVLWPARRTRLLESTH
ncbi:glycosyltransferase 87 family protein [Microbacterium sp. C7(2022)]|uniref:glycosyltransferase 87 family protein n=1 Tax=Microbacterium sp. C7(2022) TaxID=2992759 RepID=UPI00237BC573|nr:glycosyltransferase 87 family protein [Microbacterium sp. C7(2022)]MDE0547268.1 glycosyltransferase 87 family protein [Microbacterium sp. C7(2022)]